jgi:hypothetical protein
MMQYAYDWFKMLVEGFESGQDVLTYVRHMTEYNGTAGKITKQAGTGNYRSAPGGVDDQERQADSIRLKPRLGEKGTKNLPPDFHFQRDRPNLLILFDALIYAGSDAMNTLRSATPSG